MSEYACGTCSLPVNGPWYARCKCTVADHVLRSTVAARHPPKLIVESTPGKPIEIPSEWITWPGKERGEPMPPIIWYGEKPK